MPRLSFSSALPRTDMLSAVGMQVRFTSGADFSRINASKAIYLSDMRHISRVKVDEKGTAATGATMVQFYKGSPMPFKADHPFIFFVSDTKTDLVRFMGRVENPTA